MITAQIDRVICPVWHLNEYLKIRGAPDANNVLFIHQSVSPVLRSEFIAALKGALSFTGLSSSLCKGHSFRIGAATWAMLQGKTDAHIRHLDRWRSNSFLKYIRQDTDSL